MVMRLAEDWVGSAVVLIRGHIKEPEELRNRDESRDEGCT
jgi:hypothetical protein